MDLNRRENAINVFFSFFLSFLNASEFSLGWSVINVFCNLQFTESQETEVGRAFWRLCCPSLWSNQDWVQLVTQGFEYLHGWRVPNISGECIATFRQYNTTIVQCSAVLYCVSVWANYLLSFQRLVFSIVVQNCERFSSIFNSILRKCRADIYLFVMSEMLGPEGAIRTM